MWSAPPLALAVQDVGVSTFEWLTSLGQTSSTNRLRPDPMVFDGITLYVNCP